VGDLHQPRSRIPAFMFTDKKSNSFLSNRTPGPGTYRGVRQSPFDFKVRLRLTDEATGFGTARRPCLSRTIDPAESPVRKSEFNPDHVPIQGNLWTEDQTAPGRCDMG
jgi:hypothetical protein